MKYTVLGKSDLRISRICLGCMSYGNPQKGTLPWVLDEESSKPFIRRALEIGINYFDTADLYSEGASEEILGRAIKDFARREEVIIATKVFFPLQSDPESGGLSRRAIMRGIDASLKRLNMDYVDLYQIHRWDYNVPIEETLEALHDVVKAGKARYIGASSMFAWQFSKALYTADLNGWTRFISMQNHYNLLYREEEREMMGLCEDQEIAVIPWSPLARGKLARPWTEDNSTYRFQTDPFTKRYYGATQDVDRAVVDHVAEVAKKYGRPQSQIALAWLLSNPVVAAPVVGATKLHHLDDAASALTVTLSDDDMAFLEAPYVPHKVAGFDQKPKTKYQKALDKLQTYHSSLANDPASIKEPATKVA